jgi:hypothetical protein
MWAARTKGIVLIKAISVLPDAACCQIAQLLSSSSVFRGTGGRMTLHPGGRCLTRVAMEVLRLLVYYVMGSERKKRECCVRPARSGATLWRWATQEESWRMSGYLCRVCGQHHEDLPFSYGAGEPVSLLEVPAEERVHRVTMDSDLCVIDRKSFFVHGNIEIPVADHPTPFFWGVWVSVSESSFNRMIRLWEDPGRVSQSPYFGCIDTALPMYPATIHLLAAVHERPVGHRPCVKILNEEHPLHREQTGGGMTVRRVQEIAEYLLHSKWDRQ